MIPMFLRALLLTLLFAVPVAADEATPEIKVERQDTGRIRSLEFLHENQAFLRGQLDRLRTRTQWRTAEADELTARQEWLRGLGLELDAAADSVRAERVTLEGRTLLRRIDELAALEEQLDRLESQIDAQAARLIAIEADYTGRQETALALLATGLPIDDARAFLVHTLDGDPVRVELDEITREALDTGAIATLLHDFVEPRHHVLRIEVERADGSTTTLGTVELDAQRDRLNFVQVALDGADETGQLPTDAWTR